MIQLLSSDEEATARMDEPCTIVLKIYIPDYKALGCNSEYVMTCDTGLTFKALAEKLFDVAGITKDPSKYRFVPAIPAYRTELKVPEKLTSKYKISYALSKKLIGVNKIIYVYVLIFIMIFSYITLFIMIFSLYITTFISYYTYIYYDFSNITLFIMIYISI